MKKPPSWFDAWRNNDFWHLEQKVKQIHWLTLTILAVLIGMFVVRAVLG